jgi:hypothetical protein
MDLKEQNRELEDDNKRLENRNKGLLMENLQLTNTRADLEKSFALTYQEFIRRMLPLLGLVGPNSNKKTFTLYSILLMAGIFHIRHKILLLSHQ